MINKNKVNIKDTKKILHKVGKKWVVVSAVLLGLVAGGSVVSHMNVNADANQATTQTVQSQNSDQPKTSSAQSSVAPASSSKASTSGPTHEKLKSTASANSGESSVASSTNQDVNSSLGNVTTSQDSQASNNSSDGVNYVDQLLSFNVDDLFNVVSNNKNNSVYPRLMNDLNRELNNGSGTAYSQDVYLNNINEDMQNLNENNFSNLNNNFSNFRSQLERSIQNNRHINQSLSQILFNMHYGIDAGTDVHDVDNQYNNASIAYCMNALTKPKLHIDDTVVPNPSPITSSEASDIVTIYNDVSKINDKSPAVDDYQSVFSGLSSLVSQNASQQATTLNNISYNINDMLNYAKLPNDKFTDALKAFASEATSKSVSLTHAASNASGSASNVPSSQNSHQSNGSTSSSGMIPKSPSISSKSNSSSSGDNSTSRQNTNGSSHASASQDSSSAMGQSTQSNQNINNASQSDTDRRPNVDPINSLPDFNIPMAPIASSVSVTPMSSAISSVTDNNSVPSTQISSSVTSSATSTSNGSKASHSAKSTTGTYLKNNDFKRAKKNRTVVSTKGFYEYKRNRHGKMKRISFVKPGTKLAVKRVVQNGKLTKLELTNGHVVTANKHLVKLANVKPFKRISTYARALRRANYRVRHNHRLTKFRANRIKKRLVTANRSKIKAQRRFNRRHTRRNHQTLNRAVSKLTRIENALLK